MSPLILENRITPFEYREKGPGKIQSTTLVHTGVMASSNRVVRQSVSLPASIAAQVRSLAKRRRVSSNRILVELIENGIEAEKSREQEFFSIAERFRNATDPGEAK